MSRLAPQRDMSADEVIRCSYDAMALVALCEHVADGLSELGVCRPDLLGAIGTALNLASELMSVVHDCLEMHEGPPGNTKRPAGARGA